jgi:hypothetical protein
MAADCHIAQILRMADRIDRSTSPGSTE